MCDESGLSGLNWTPDDQFSGRLGKSVGFLRNRVYFWNRKRSLQGQPLPQRVVTDVLYLQYVGTEVIIWERGMVEGGGDRGSGSWGVGVGRG